MSDDQNEAEACRQLKKSWEEFLAAYLADLPEEERLAFYERRNSRRCGMHAAVETGAVNGSRLH